MLGRLSVSVDGARQKNSKSVADRLNVFSGRKQVPFHVVISELRAELMNTKQHAPGHPCVLLWVRGDTVHITEDSVGQTVLSWSDTYFAQVVPLHVTGTGAFRPKECKFKVQQKGKTITKTAIVDVSKYCSEIGTARDQSVPSGTLYFVISTAPAADSQEEGSACDASSQSFAQNITMRGSQTPSLQDGGPAGGEMVAAATARIPDCPSPSHSCDSSRYHQVPASPYTAVAAKYGNAVAGAATSSASSISAVMTPSGFGSKGGKGEGSKGEGKAAATPDTLAAAVTRVLEDVDLDRASASTAGRGNQSRPSGGAPAGWATGLTVAVRAATGKSSSPSQNASGDGRGDSEDRPSLNGGMFRRKARGATANKPGTAFAAAAGAAAASAAAAASSLPGGGKGAPASTVHTSMRKSDSANIGSGGSGVTDGVTDAQSAWDSQAERSLSQAALAGVSVASRAVRGSDSGLDGKSAGHRAIRSFTSSPLARGPGGEPLPMQLQLPQIALMRSLSRRSNAPSTCSDTAASGLKGVAEGGGGGFGFGSWLRSGLAFRRSFNQSAPALEAAADVSGPTCSTQVMVGGNGEQEERSSALEVDIRGTTEVAELRELALDLLHERDEWRARALAAHDSLGRAQTARGSAVREVQRLEIRLRQYQDELGRRTDGSLLQELVEAKVRIAELANENMKLRRQITHMGPLFYDDSGDEFLPDPRA